MMESKLVNYTTGDIYRILKEDILKLRLLPGQKVSENELAQRFNSSRTPVHSAFMQLKGEGLINILPQKGSFISLMDFDYIQQIIFLRIQLERAIYSEVAQAYTEDFVQKIEVNLEDQRAEIEKGPSSDGFYQYSNQYHRLYYQCARKDKLWHRMTAIQYDYIRYRRLTYAIAEHCTRKYQEHLLLFQLVKEKNLDGIYDFVPKHLGEESKFLEEHYDAYNSFFMDFPE